MAVPLWVARLIVSQKTAEKLAGRHGLDWREVHDAVVCVAGLQYTWHEHPERGRRTLVEVEIRGRRCLVVLYTFTMRGMMVGMRAGEAQDFYEEDEDLARVFALFDAAEKGRTASPQRPPSQGRALPPLRERVHELGTQLRQDVRKLRLRDRFALLLRHVADSLEQRTKV